MRGLTDKPTKVILLAACAFCLVFSPAPALAAPEDGDLPDDPALSSSSSASSSSTSSSGSAEEPFPQSSAYDSHSTEDLDLIRSFEQQWSVNGTATVPAMDSDSEQAFASPLKVTPPEGRHPTALRLFRLIPPTIFDNTVQGLDENDKQVLADNGRAANWVLNHLSNDDLEFTSTVPYSNTKVRLHLFYAVNGDIFVACGAESGDGCAMELWQRDTRGRIIPVPIPDEPSIGEFLVPERECPAEYEVTMLMCLDAEAPRLKAVPLVWTPTGLGSLPLDYDIYYLWNGETFVKTAVQHAP